MSKGTSSIRSCTRLVGVFILPLCRLTLSRHRLHPENPGLSRRKFHGTCTNIPRTDRCELRVSQHFSTFYGSSVQSMGTQLNALPALPVRARTVSGCLNSALLGLERNRPAVITSQLPGEPASALLCSCFATESLAQTAPLSRATNLHIKANRVPPCGFVQEPVPERPQTLAVKPSSAQGPSSGTGFFLFGELGES